MDQRLVLSIAKDLGLTAHNRREIGRILMEDDYVSPFPISGPITYAIAAVLIHIIDDYELPLKALLPMALSHIDCNVSSAVVTPGSIKRACLRRISLGKDIHERIDSLYSTKTDELGPFCAEIGIGKQWLADKHEYPLQPGTVISNGVILELDQHLKKSSDLNWMDAQRWLSRILPDQELPSCKTLQNNWKRLKNKKNSKKYSSKKSLRQELMEEKYSLPKTKVSDPSVLPETFVHVEDQEEDILHKNKKRKPTFPGDVIIGKRIKHKFQIRTSAGKTKYEWFKGTVTGKATDQDIESASDEDMDYVKNGLTLYVVDYDKDDEPETIALQADWENGDIVIIAE